MLVWIRLAACSSEEGDGVAPSPADADADTDVDTDTDADPDTDTDTDTVPPIGDRDGDGSPDELDCEPDDPGISPLACEICQDAVDQDCDGGDADCHPALDASTDLL